jgi:hypothetical protein
MYIKPQQRFCGCGASVAREFKGARHSLGDELTADLIRFCSAMDMTPTKVIRRAVRQYIDAQEADPAVRQRLQKQETRKGSDKKR